MIEGIIFCLGFGVWVGVMVGLIVALNVWYWLHERPRMTQAEIEEERLDMRIW